jgi:archaellum biogenesis protein FlaJ (TadC family)
MPTSTSSPTDRAWEAIEHERGRDRLIKRISIAAWSVTFVIVVLLVIATAIQVSIMSQFGGGGTVGLVAGLSAAKPTLIMLGALAVLIATLSTVGIFLRLRTTSLHEIQLRLAALEETLTTSAAERGSR